ncbi:MAG: transposase [Candidatus Electronema sp. V4]|uniref:transposase n=1 Tax=Candidatus Electronema sp. V4 TaxID=3454756 RepID=UPI0040559BC9
MFKLTIFMGRIESDIKRKLFGDIFPGKERRGRGMPAARPRKVLNSLLFILAVGCRWRGLPLGPRWVSKSFSHRRLKSWHLNGALNDLKK